MKFCVDCANFIPVADDPQHLLARCSAVFTTNPVSGKKQLRYAFETRVYSDGPCGTQAVLFIPKNVEVSRG